MKLETTYPITTLQPLQIVYFQLWSYQLIEIMGLQDKRIFTLASAQDLLQRLIYRLTEESSREVKYWVSCLDALPDKKSARSLEIQTSINDIIGRWQNKIERLGARPKGLWLVDFDKGDGYYCWKFPETEICYFHGYQDGFTGRKIILEEDLNHAHSSSPN